MTEFENAELLKCRISEICHKMDLFLSVDLSHYWFLLVADPEISEWNGWGANVWMSGGCPEVRSRSRTKPWWGLGGETPKLLSSDNIRRIIHVYILVLLGIFLRSVCETRTTKWDQAKDQR